MIGTKREGRVLVTGAAGMLGSQLLRTAPDGLEAFGTDVAPGQDPQVPVQAPGVDLTDRAQVSQLLDGEGPFVGVLHGAAYTAVDKAEEDVDLAHRVNALAPEILAQACRERQVPMVLVSTDFVFDGRADSPYGVDDEPSPIGVYGRTKFEGEERARAAWADGLATVRTQWLYGPRGKHFPGTILRLASERDELKVVADQVGSPTTTIELAPALWDTLRLAPPGTYHGACEGVCSWYDLAAATLEIWARLDRGADAQRWSQVKVNPCTTEEFPRPAPRPAYSALDSSKLAQVRGRTLKPWKEALEDFLKQEARPPTPSVPHEN